MKNQTKNSLEKFTEDRNRAYNAFNNLDLGHNDDLGSMTTEDILAMVAEIEAAEINLEDHDDIEKLSKIISSYDRDDRTPVYYDNECIGKVLTNHSSTVWELLSLLGISPEETDSNGELIWDLEKFTLNPTPQGSSGRPPLYDKTMKLVSIYLTMDMIDWLKKQGSISETIRSLIEEKQKK